PTEPTCHSRQSRLSSFSQAYAPHPDRDPFPTRRSSDLSTGAGFRAADSRGRTPGRRCGPRLISPRTASIAAASWPAATPQQLTRSEEHTSELQSLAYLVCRLLLEKKKQRS